MKLHLRSLPILLLIFTLASVSFYGCAKEGCTDPNSDNFDPEATQNDGSCFTRGCTDPNSDYFNPEATQDDGSCFIRGCTDVNSDNYDPEATQDDGSCVPSRDKFIGQYNVAEACPSGNSTYSMTITGSGSAGDAVVINGLSGLSEPITATIQLANLNIASQVVNVGGISVTVTGTGVLNGAILSINFTYSVAGGGETCSMSCNKI